MDEHLKCPFCGGSAFLDRSMGDKYKNAMYRACCKKCGIEPAEILPTRKAAWEWWDKRCKP